MLNLLQDFQLSEDIADLVTLNALLLVHVLHGIHLLCVPLLHNAHLEGKGISVGHVGARALQFPPPQSVQGITYVIRSGPPVHLAHLCQVHCTLPCLL